MLLLNKSGHAVKSLRSHLIQLVLVAVLPVLLFAGGLFIFLAQEQKNELDNNLNGTAKAIEASVNEQLKAVILSLQVLAYTEDFRTEESSALYRKLNRAIKNLENWESISVTDLNGNQLLDTSYPYGSPLPSLKNDVFFLQARKAEATAISNFRTLVNENKKVISIAVPVLKAGKINRILIASISVKSLIVLLQKQGIPSEWTAALVDRNFTFMARSRNSVKYLGIHAPILSKLVQKSQNGIIRAINKDGVDSYGVYHVSNLTGWTIALVIPSEKLSLFTNALKFTFLAAVLFMILGVALAIYFGRKIADPIIALSYSAEAFGRGHSSALVDSSVEEVQILATSMEHAGVERIRSENTIKTLFEISSSLAGELDLRSLLQSFTDQTTVLTRAEYGAYFENNEYNDIITRSGKEIKSNSEFTLPHVVGCLIRLDDLTKDERYRSNSKFRSYLSVPVISRTGTVLGGLIFGHSKPSIFTEKDERLIGAVAAHAATAIDNANLYSEANQAIQLRDTFLSVASHELKTPLTSIYLQFEILKRNTLKTNDDSKIHNLFERFQSQLERLNSLIDELLDVSSITSGKMSLHPEKIELEKLVSDICANFEIEAIQKGSPISLVIKQPVNGVWDVNRVEQVVMNLVSNAIKYGNKKPIEVIVSKNDKWAIVQIVDKGIGIAQADQTRIFQRFERAINSFTISGLGLGLFICKEIMLRHGGDIKVDSKLSEGSTFTLRLPLT